MPGLHVVLVPLLLLADFCPLLAEGVARPLGCCRNPCSSMGGELLVRLRGGSAIPKGSCYPLHGETDTDNQDMGNPVDPYSVHAVAAKVPFAKGQIEAAFLEEIQADPKAFQTMIALAQVLKGLRNDAEAAEAWVVRAYAIEPSFWWFQQHAHKYVRPEVMQQLQEQYREDILRKHAELVPTDELSPEELQEREMQLQILEMKERERIAQTVQAEKELREAQIAHEQRRQGNWQEQARLAEEEYDRQQMTKEDRMIAQLREEYMQAAKRITRRQLEVRFENEDNEELNLGDVYDDKGNVIDDAPEAELAPDDGAYGDGTTAPPPPPPPPADKKEKSAMEKVKERLLREADEAAKVAQKRRDGAGAGEGSNGGQGGKVKKKKKLADRLLDEYDQVDDDEDEDEDEEDVGLDERMSIGEEPAREWVPEATMNEEIEAMRIPQHYVEFEKGIYDGLDEYRRQFDVPPIWETAGPDEKRAPRNNYGVRGRKTTFRERLRAAEAAEEERVRAHKNAAPQPEEEEAQDDGGMMSDSEDLVRGRGDDSDDDEDAPPATPRSHSSPQHFVQVSPNSMASHTPQAPNAGSYAPGAADESFYFQEEAM